MKPTLFALLFIFTFSLGYSQDLETQIDYLVNTTYKPNEPGAAVLVTKNGDVIYRKAFGLSNLELGIPMQPENVFEIGSITKQFTAIAILMLEEQGKLKVEDDITKYIPDYPTQGTTITIHHLLNHTSGIKSYTGMQSFRNLARTDMTPTELINVFKNEPMDFKPGEQFLYNNSGYILLGHIIEVITGQSYENFIEQHIFNKLGMSSSYYGNMQQLIKNRASGYQQNETGYVNADYLSLTLPYAAGSLMSTVDDLFIWQKALNTNQLISKNTYEKAINGSTLNNGEHINYGYGLGANKIQGSKSISHGGGIFGYTTMGIYMPQEDVFVSVLTNCDCNPPGGVANKIAALAIGKPFAKKEDAIALNEEQLQKWVGAYEFENGIIRHITLKDKQLYSYREDTANDQKIYPMTASHFIFESGTSYDFYIKDGNRMAKMTSEGVTNTGKGIDKAFPKERTSVALSNDILKQYVGKYELQPNLIATFTIENNSLFTQLTGQPKFEVFAERKDHFFLKVVPAEITFNRNNNKVESLTLEQGGQVITAKKIE